MTRVMASLGGDADQERPGLVGPGSIAISAGPTGARGLRRPRPFPCGPAPKDARSVDNDREETTMSREALGAFALGLALVLGAPPARADGVTERVSVGRDGIQGNDFSGAPSLSAVGRFVAFGSDAGNLVPGDTNGVSDVFVHAR